MLFLSIDSVVTASRQCCDIAYWYADGGSAISVASPECRPDRQHREADDVDDLFEE
jgi:hypothetical protein